MLPKVAWHITRSDTSPDSGWSHSHFQKISACYLGLYIGFYVPCLPIEGSCPPLPA